MGIYLQELNEINERISKKELRVCVIGVGTIGLPLATFLAKSGFDTKGLDINEQRYRFYSVRFKNNFSN